MTTTALLPTTVVGSYPQPGWLLDHELLRGLVPRMRMPELWRIGAERLVEAQDDAALLALRDMERAGIDIVSDGEVRRESYSSTFVSALEGIACDAPATIRNAAGRTVEVPRIVGPVRRGGPAEVRDLEFLRARTEHAVKVALPGPFTIARQSANEFYEDPDELVADLAAALNAELRDLEAAGADVLQLDEPLLRDDPQAAQRVAVAAIDRALDGIAVPTVVHLCFGYAAIVGGEKPASYPFLEQLAASAATQISIEAAQPGLDLDVLRALSPKTIVLGVIDLGDERVESAALVAQRLRAGLAHVDAERLVAAPDCGMKYLPRETAFGKLRALADGAALVRAELAGAPR